MPNIPRDTGLDSTWAFLRDPYRFISTRSKFHQSPVFQTRLMLQKTLCLTGAEAARLICDPDRFVRQNAAPKRLQKTLFGQDGVQGLDGDAHRHRKALFMGVLTPANVQELAELSEVRWREYARTWRPGESIVLYEIAREILCRTVCDWAGAPIAERDVQQWTQDLAALYEHAGAIGLQHWQARKARRRLEQWAAELVESTRAAPPTPEQSPLERIAHYKDQHGQPLDLHTASVELLNLLRPTVAVSVFITFAALALHKHPFCLRNLQSGDERDIGCFVQEVRRFYPFFPAISARVKEDFLWEGFAFGRGTLVLLDLYGTNHDSQLWEEADRFKPERFRSNSPSPYCFIPQGPGDPHVNHRCPGEGVAVALMSVAVRFLARSLQYEVPEQDLSITWDRLPALPRSHFVMRNARITM
ncbi:cytochrome P450 [Stutzerimonas kunmingensis]|jgi:fatty-acid peroxygenase|uniref:cytochrome P450 n=1 Tax=Stutzerimonas kunmingensis TaxID=1211807 RepID=UPI000C99331C|nr:cytochrome P450 [Stutzerimonas kunmingensis]MAD54989.1 cytochrome P450 [Idiomarinaceae bacterium]MBD3877979.1 cytochrome P450 [Stutzerimonas kunmingensis]